MQRSAFFLVVGAGVVVLLGIALFTGGGYSHTVTTTLPSGGRLNEGYIIRAAGRPVGEVEDVSLTRDHQVRVEMKLGNKMWPLPEDSRMFVRLGGTIRISDRYIDIVRGKSDTMIEDGGTLAAKQFQVPVEYEDVFSTFSPDVRSDLNAFLDESGQNFQATAKPLRRAVEASPPAFRQISEVLNELGGDGPALDSLIRQGDRVLGAINSAQPGLGEFIDGANATLTATGNQARNIQIALDQAPATMRDLQSTLARAESTIESADRLATELGPGVELLQDVPQPLTRALRRLISIRPDATGALTSLRFAAPDTTRLLARTEALLPTLGSASKQASKQVGCIRPYAPEIASFSNTWGAGAWSQGDSRGKYLRAALGGSQIPASTNATSRDLKTIAPSIKKLLIRPPGQLVEQPWFQPQCGAGPEVLEEGYDPELGFTTAASDMPSSKR